jgi:hypothetical protein
MKKIFTILILLLGVFFAFKPILADSNTYVPYSSASIVAQDPNWNTCRGTTTGSIRQASFQNGQLLTSPFFNERSFFTFDTSDLPDDAVIQSATLSLTGAGSFSNPPEVRQYQIYDSTHSDTVVAGDYDLRGTTPLSNTKANTDLFFTGQTTWTFNATGLANISLTSFTKFSLYENTIDYNNVAPSNSVQEWKYFNPVLKVNYVASSTLPVSYFLWTTSTMATDNSLTSHFTFYYLLFKIFLGVLIIFLIAKKRKYA